MIKLSYENKRKLVLGIGIGLIVLCSFAFLVLFTGLIKPLRYFLLGTFGLFAYPIFIILFFVGLALINKKKYVLPVKYTAYIICTLVSLLAIIQNIIVGNFSGGFFEFLGYNYTTQLTPGGIIIGLIISPFKYAFGTAGVYAIFAISLVVFSCLIADYLLYVKKKAAENAPLKLQRQKEELKLKKQQEKYEAKIQKNARYSDRGGKEK